MITYRMTKGSALTYPEMDENFRDLRHNTTLQRVLENGNSANIVINIPAIKANTLNISTTLTVKSISINGSTGTTGQVIKADGTGNVYWGIDETGGGTGSIVTSDAYTFSNTVTFTNNVYMSRINVGGTFGTAGQVLRSTGYTAQWASIVDTQAFDKANSANYFTYLVNANTVAAFDKANSANLLAYNTGISSNAFASATIAGANAAVGAGANSYAASVGVAANNYSLSLVGTIGTAANNYADSVGSGANAQSARVGVSANAFASATIAGANTVVGAGANAYTNFITVGINSNVNVVNTATIAAFTKANDAYTLAQSAGSGGSAVAAFVKANTANVIAYNAYEKANAANYYAYVVNSNTIAAFIQANLALNVAQSAFTKANTGGGGGISVVETADTAPASPSDGTLWWNSTLGKLFIYYDDGTSSQWVEASPGTGLANTSDVSFSGNLYFPTGNVGIGIGSSATSKLTIYDSMGRDNFISIGNPQATWLNGIDSSGNFSIYSNQSKNLLFSSGGTEKMRLSSSGFLGIGTVPGTQLHLLHTNTGSDQMLSVDNTGGTASYISISTSSTYKGLLGYNKTTGQMDWMVGSWGSGANTLVFGTSNAQERMRITDTGNVGIGTLTPSAKLDVSGTIRDSKGDVRDIPVSNQTIGYGLSLSDTGKVIATNTAVYVPNTIFYAGNTISIYNNSASSITVTQNSSVTMYLAGTATTGNRTLAQRAVATLICVAANTFVIAGAGVT